MTPGTTQTPTAVPLRGKPFVAPVKSAPPVTGPHYHRSFASYEIPFRPIEPVAASGTEGLASYYSAYLDQGGRVVRFDKIRLLRAGPPLTVPLTTPAVAGASVYFAAEGASTADARPGSRCDYAATEGLPAFYAGKAGPSGTDAQVGLMRRRIEFTDLYAYWPDGRLRSRIKHAPGKAAEAEYFSEGGAPLKEPATYAWASKLESGSRLFEAGDYTKAWPELEGALRLAAAEQSLKGVAAAMLALAFVDVKEGRHADASEKCRLALPAWKALDDRAEEARTWRLLGDLERAVAEPENAAACYQEAEWLEREPGS